MNLHRALPAAMRPSVRLLGLVALFMCLAPSACVATSQADCEASQFCVDTGACSLADEFGR